MRSRRGINLIGLVLVVLAIAGIGFGLSTLARQAGRSGHWFYHSQIAHDLADAALKQAFFQMTQANSANAVANAQYLKPELQALFDALRNGSTGELTLLDSGTSTLPPALAEMVAKLADFSPQCVVKVTPTDGGPLWTGLLNGMPALDGERQGALSLVARAWVKSPTGIPVERTITLEKVYRIINPCPPLLGRFSLFAQERGTEECNFVPMRFDPTSGNATLTGNVKPLVLESPVKGSLVAPGTPNLDRAGFVRALPQGPFLDKQGWVYLGGTSAQPWKLRLAHGYTEAGESMLLPGYKPSAPTPFRGEAGENAAFQNRLIQAFQAAGVQCLPSFPTPAQGLYLTFHGFADNYPQIAVDPLMYDTVWAGSAPTPQMDFGPGTTSFVRLFGNPDAVSPTLVFGPAFRSVMRRATIFALMGPIERCQRAGFLRMALFKLEAAQGNLRQILSSTFQGDYPKWGTGPYEDQPFAVSLAVALSGGGNGAYMTDGTLGQTGTPAATRTYQSQLVPYLANIDPATGFNQAALDKMVNGDLESDKLFKGNLGAGFSAFFEAMKKKLTYEVQPEAFNRRILVGTTLRVPGVVLIDQSAELVLNKVERVEGGILITKGPIRLKGDIARQPAPPLGVTAAPAPPANGTLEPLTLVSMTGDIVLEAGARNVDCQLVALNGKVKFAGDVEITGGVAGKTLDLQGLAAAGNRKIKYSPDNDPLGPNGQLLKVYYGGDDKLQVSGGGS